ncbi:MAG: pyrroline-5-carboxylate reductase [Anaerovoracaceae bacterium]
MNIGFIGAGNMGGAILSGYASIAAKSKDKIFVFDLNQEKCTGLEKKFSSVTSCDTIDRLVKKSDIIILGVKPNVFDKVLPSVAQAYRPSQLVVSMAAGISIKFLEGYLSEDSKVVRIMPNTPAKVGEAMVAVCRNKNVTEDDFEKPLQLFNAIGKAEEIEEELMHCVIGVSGSSPAYTYMYIEALISAAVENGMSEEKAKVFAAQSVLGAAKMVMESDESPEQLRINVCSPGGTTIQAVENLFEHKFEETVKSGFQAAVDKSKAMTK